ncbi:hypothetical protein ACRCAC_003149, partial [Escherichia coli]
IHESLSAYEKLRNKDYRNQGSKSFYLSEYFYFLLFVYLFYCCKIVRAIDKIIGIPMNYTNCFYCKP